MRLLMKTKPRQAARVVLPSIPRLRRLTPKLAGIQYTPLGADAQRPQATGRTSAWHLPKPAKTAGAQVVRS
jgi:hypothetical protein